MKKIMAILLSLALLLGCAAGLSETVEKQSLGTISVNGEFTIRGEIPEGYRIYPVKVSDNAIINEIISSDQTRPMMAISVAYDELYADVERLNDLDEAALSALEETFTMTDPYAVITYDETAYGTRLLVCRTISGYADYLTFFSIYKGYLVEFVMTPGNEAEEKILTDEQIASCTRFLSELDFVSGTEEEISTVNATHEVLITGFDAEAKTVDLTILVPYTFTNYQLSSLSEGSTVRIGEEDVEIGTLTYEKDSVDMNEEYHFTLRPDGLYTVSDYDFPLMRKALEKTVSVPEGLKFTDQVNAETGEILDQPLELNAEGFFAALEKAKTEGIAFDSQNVSVSFDGDGNLAEVTRSYAPWQ